MFSFQIQPFEMAVKNLFLSLSFKSGFENDDQTWLVIF